ncbi:10231_t:CDS:2 [Funneliformis geosporum]|nr:10231_t:CDS:2 [Funneliformis geosporum]
MNGIFSKDTIKITAETVGVTNLKDTVAAALAHDVEYRVHEIIQEANKFMRHSKRTRLTGEDINNALRVHDEWEFENVINSAMPRVPTDVSFSAHWIAVDGVQPSIPNNPVPTPPLEEASKAEVRKKNIPKSDDLQIKAGLPVTNNIEVKPLVQHVLSMEHQMFYEKVTKAMRSEEFKDTKTKIAVLHSLEHDTGLAQLLPYFIHFICEQPMLKMAEALINNKSLFLEPHLHNLMPAILTCVVRRKLGLSMSDKHWSLRELGARILAKICDRYGGSYNDLQPRITRNLMSSFMDTSKSLFTHYGCIVAMGALGREVIRSILVPNLKTYGDLLSTYANDPDQIKRDAANRCYKTIVDILAKLKKTVDPLIDIELQETPNLHERLENKIGKFFADGVLRQIGDDHIIMAIINS